MAKQAQLLPVYAAVGSDKLKRDRTLERFRSRLSGPMAEFDYDELLATKSLDDEALERLLGSLAQFPLSGGQRLVVVREAQELPKSFTEALVTYLKNPNPDASLLLLTEKLAKNTRLYKAIARVSPKAIIDCNPPQKRAFTTHLQRMAQEAGLTLTYDATQALIERLGQDTVALSGALRTLRELYGQGSTIGRAQVEADVSAVETPGPWLLADAVSARDARRALRLLAQSLGESPMGLHFFLVKRIRELLITKELDAEGRTQELPRALGYNASTAWRCKNHVAWSRKFSRAELLDALEGALTCEKAIKGSGDTQSALVEWILSLCG